MGKYKNKCKVKRGQALQNYWQLRKQRNSESQNQEVVPDLSETVVEPLTETNDLSIMAVDEEAMQIKESQESSVSYVNSIGSTPYSQQRQQLQSPMEYTSPYPEFGGSRSNNAMSPLFSESDSGSTAWAWPDTAQAPPPSYNQRSADEMRADESLGSAATISAVLYANTNHPEWKTEFPNWVDRCKQILKKWRALPSVQKAPYLQRARDNRSAIRMKKAQQRTAPELGTTPSQKPQLARPSIPPPTLSLAQEVEIPKNSPRHNIMTSNVVNSPFNTRPMQTIPTSSILSPLTQTSTQSLMDVRKPPIKMMNKEDTTPIPESSPTMKSIQMYPMSIENQQLQQAIKKEIAPPQQSPVHRPFTPMDFICKERDTDTPDSIVSCSSPECLETEPPNRFPGLKLIDDEEENEDSDPASGRISPVIPIIAPVPVRVKPVSVYQSKDDEDNQKALKTLDTDAAKVKGGDSPGSTETNENVTVTLTLTSGAAEDILGVLKELAGILHIPPPTSYQIIERTASPPSHKLGLDRSKGKDEKEGTPIDIQSILNGAAKFCRHCDVVILDSVVRAKASEFPLLSANKGNAEEILCESDSELYFCSTQCFGSFAWGPTNIILDQ